MSDDWVRERAYDIASHAIGDNEHARTLAARIAALVVEAIDRTRSEERANAVKALKSAYAMEEKAVAAERERLTDRLRNPDEALVEAFQDASDEYYNADHDVTLEGWFTHICRAIAATLDEKETASE